jgi:hypothetical protein
MERHLRQQSSLNDGSKESKKAIEERDCILTKIARETLQIRTLETRDRQCLDFYEGDDGTITVWELNEALQEAYEAGRRNVLKPVCPSDAKGNASAITLLGKTTLRRMLSAVYIRKDPLFDSNVYGECSGANRDFKDDKSIGDEVVYVYYHRDEDETVMTNIEGDFWGVAGSSAGFKGKVDRSHLCLKNSDGKHGVLDEANLESELAQFC